MQNIFHNLLTINNLGPCHLMSKGFNTIESCPKSLLSGTKSDTIVLIRASLKSDPNIKTYVSEVYLREIQELRVCRM